MRRKTKKVIASVMAALMMLSLAPVSAFNGVLVNDVVAADLDYEGLDLTGGVVAGESFGGSLGLQSLTTADYSASAKSAPSTLAGPCARHTRPAPSCAGMRSCSACPAAPSSAR